MLLIDFNKYVGTPYKHNGRTIQEGLDCLGLIGCIYEELGMPLPPNDSYNNDPEVDWYKTDPDRYWRYLQRLGKPTGLEDLKAGDIVYFALINGTIVSHAGVMLDDESFIHTLQKRNCRINKMDRFWQKKFRGARKMLD